MTLGVWKDEPWSLAMRKDPPYCHTWWSHHDSWDEEGQTMVASHEEGLTKALSVASSYLTMKRNNTCLHLPRATQ